MTDKVAVRRDIATLNPVELSRFATAFAELKNSEDWGIIAAIHGGGFSTNNSELAKKMIPLIIEFVAQFRGTPPLEDTLLPRWATTSFCTHGSPLFLIWHRPYLMALELLLQHHDPDPGNEQPLALHYWKWDNGSSSLPAVLRRRTLLGFDGKSIPNPFINGTGRDGTPISRGAGFRISSPGALLRVSKALQNKQYHQFVTGNGTMNSNIEEPHNSIHISFEPGADMGSVATAAFDPIFWLHHSNVERIHHEW